MKLFSSDWHLYHNATLEKGDRPFDSTEEMNDAIIKNMFEETKRGDDFYFLGDLSWEKEGVERVLKEARKRKVRFHWVAGNHDKKMIKQYHGRIKEFNKANTIDNTLIIKLTDEEGKHYPTFLSHYPMFTWDRSHYDSFLLFGHHHNNTHGNYMVASYEKAGKRLNVNCEFFEYKPVNELEVINIMKSRPHNWDFIDKSKK